VSTPRIKLNLTPGYYLTYPDGAVAYPQTFETEELASKKRSQLGFDDWKISFVAEVHA